MAKYLVIDTTGGNECTGPRSIIETKDLPGAIAVLTSEAYSFEQTFSIFDLEKRTLIKVEQEKIIRALDGSDESDTTVLGEYTEADIIVLKEEAATEGQDGLGEKVNVER